MLQLTWFLFIFFYLDFVGISKDAATGVAPIAVNDQGVYVQAINLCFMERSIVLRISANTTISWKGRRWYIRLNMHKLICQVIKSARNILHTNIMCFCSQRLASNVSLWTFWRKLEGGDKAVDQKCPLFLDVDVMILKLALKFKRYFGKVFVSLWFNLTFWLIVIFHCV